MARPRKAPFEGSPEHYYLGRAVAAFLESQKEFGPRLVPFFWDGEAWSLHFTDARGTRETLTREDLLELLLVASKQGGQKECLKCKSTKPLSQFGRNKNNKTDGRLRYCRACEAKRVKQYYRAKRGSRASA